MVPKPGPDSAYVKKLRHVFERAADQLNNDPRYKDRLLGDFVNSLAEGLPRFDPTEAQGDHALGA